MKRFSKVQLHGCERARGKRGKGNPAEVERWMDGWMDVGCGCAGRRTSCSTVTSARRILLSLSLENRANGADIIICVAFRLFHFISFVIVFSQTKKKMKDERTRREKKNVSRSNGPQLCL